MPNVLSRSHNLSAKIMLINPFLFAVIATLLTSYQQCCCPGGANCSSARQVPHYNSPYQTPLKSLCRHRTHVKSDKGHLPERVVGIQREETLDLACYTKQLRTSAFCFPDHFLIKNTQMTQKNKVCVIHSDFTKHKRTKICQCLPLDKPSKDAFILACE